MNACCNRYHRDGERPAQIGCYVQFASLFSALLTMLVGAVFGLLASFGAGRSALEAYPGLFTLGAVSRRGPSKEMAEETNFVMTLVGLGWGSEEEMDGRSPNKRVIVTASGKNVG